MFYTVVVKQNLCEKNGYERAGDGMCIDKDNNLYKIVDVSKGIKPEYKIIKMCCC